MNKQKSRYDYVIGRLMAVTGESEQVIRETFVESHGEQIESILDTITEEDIDNWEV